MAPMLSLNLITNTTTTTSLVANSTIPTETLKVICAWPVSGQYGAGSRVLYYVLVAACVIAQKTEWLMNACLAAALLIPAVTALHAVVLAAVHVDGALDMDVYGAFQICAIGILAAPVTVKLSPTYFSATGRNIIFLWTGLLLAGLMSLAIEFYRVSTSDCTVDDKGNPVPSDPEDFPYGDSCGLVCSVQDGPYSPMRQGSTDEIYVIPAPSLLTFGTATLLATACCIPAVLQLISMWMKILEKNWTSRFGDGEEGTVIPGTNNATIGGMGRVNAIIGTFLGVVEVLVFSGLVLAILIIGEKNLFSPQVAFQTEPMQSIGQWAPIVGTGLAALGSGYIGLASGDAQGDDQAHEGSTHDCTCGGRHPGGGNSGRSSRDGNVEGQLERKVRPSTETAENDAAVTDGGGRVKVASILNNIAQAFGTPRHDTFDVSDFRGGPANGFPTIPAEEQRNPDLSNIIRAYNVTPSPSRERSRAGSFRSIDEGDSASLRLGLPPTAQPPHATVPMPLPTKPRSSTLPAGAISVDVEVSVRRSHRRRDTLQVPPAVHQHSPTRSGRPSSPGGSSLRGGGASPTIVVTHEHDWGVQDEGQDGSSKIVNS